MSWPIQSIYGHSNFEQNAIAVKECLKFIFDNFGEPEEFQSDNGKEFKNQLLKDFLLNRNIKIIHGRPRNPKAQGQVDTWIKQ